MFTDTADEIIDSRDLIERLEEIENDEGATEEEIELADEIRKLADCSEDWQYGAGLIRDDYFEEYARQFAEDIGAIPDDAGWPCSYIDWEAAAEALATDYTTVEFLGHTYYVR